MDRLDFEPHEELLDELIKNISDFQDHIKKIYITESELEPNEIAAKVIADAAEGYDPEVYRQCADIFHALCFCDDESIVPTLSSIVGAEAMNMFNDIATTFFK